MSNHTCIHCGRVLESGEEYIFDEEHYCKDCLDEVTTTCDCCGRRIYTENDEGDSYRSLCDRCYRDFYTACDRCGRLVRNEDAYYLDEEDTANSTVREDTKYTRLGTMWRVICMWARIVEDEGFGLTDCFDDKGYHVDDMRGYLKNIAIVNIKKTAGESSCPTTELEKAVNGYFCLIQQQIECISPSLIVCCGTFEVVRDYLKNKATDIQDYGDYFIYNGRGYLKAPHPANRRSYQTNFDEFKKVYYGMKECSLLQNI